MANQFASITTALAILKNYYAGPIVSQFNDECPIYRGAEKGKEKWSGLQVIRPIKVRRNQGIGAVADGGTLPKIGQQITQQAIIASKFNYLRFGLTGPLIKASQGDRGAFVTAMAFEMEEGMNDMVSDMNRQVAWDGTGTLATVAANATASQTITVNGRESVEDGAKFLDVGLLVDTVVGGGNTNPIGNSAIQITNITGLTGTATVTFNTPVTVTANDTLIRSGSQANEVQGLLFALDGGTSVIYNIDRSLYPAYQGNRNNLAGAQMTLNALQQAENLALRRGGKGLSALYSDFDSQRYYQKLLTVDKRYSNTIKGDGGFSNKDDSYLEWNSKPWVPDKDSPQRVFLLNEKHLKKYVLAELEWADETGSMMIAQTGADAFEVRLRFFFNIFNEKPASMAVLFNYASP
jgi:hypothetical protein